MSLQNKEKNKHISQKDNKAYFMTITICLFEIVLSLQINTHAHETKFLI